MDFPAFLTRSIYNLRFTHMVTSAISTLRRMDEISSSGIFCKYSSIASVIFYFASSTVFPNEKQPSNSGHETLKRPSSSC